MKSFHHFTLLHSELSSNWSNIAFSFCMCALCLTSSALIGQDKPNSVATKINRITRLVDQGGELFKSKDYAASAKKIREAQIMMIELASNADEPIIKKLRKDYDRIEKAQRLLKEQGERFEELPEFDSLAKAGEQSGPTAGDGSGSTNVDEPETGSGSKEMDGAELVSFTKTVAPIIVEHCGQCHIDQQLGKYSAETYDDLRKKSRKGIVIKPKHSDQSRLVSLVESGQMPKRGDKLPQEKIQILKNWIDQGAKFDGETKSKKEKLTVFADAAKESSNGDEGSSSRSGKMQEPLGGGL